MKLSEIAVIFDMDGLLLDTESISFKSMQTALYEVGHEFTEYHFFQTMGKRKKEIFELLIDIYEDEDSVKKALLHDEHMYHTHLNTIGADLNYGARELIDYLYENKVKMIVATSSHKELAIKLLTNAGIIDEFEDVIAGDEVEHSKPHPEIFLKAKDRLGMEVDKCIVLEDSLAGLKAAYNGGFKSIYVPSLAIRDRDAENYAFRIEENLMEVKKYFESLAK